ncbi:uncharacterized protein EAF02_009576 [Botrytis sinoallii]|uniref:uncharacterized protein n=1 Tax=Botrytis sinoallii TaxID=1463999 RepID=UPI001901EDAC|nr:uncharacterized protein EAF02_009576 [Botrytis sinoallii]KAF7868840.1 hypothetical protein EAF02_009576 [Botrytis sinoallii]
MDSDDNGLVTIEKNHFEALLRSCVQSLTVLPHNRADFNGSEGGDFDASQDADNITISRKEYDTLKQSVREYENLRRSLINGGITEETLNSLTKGDDENGADQSAASNVSATHEDPDESTTFMTQSPPPLTPIDHGHQVYTYGTPRTGTIFASRPQEYKSSQNHKFQYQETPNQNLHTSGHDDNNTFDFEAENNSETNSRRPSYEKFAQRTIQLYNLSDGTTHADVCDAVRGGMLLDMYLRTHDHTAIISFLEQAQANEFFRHVKRNDLYVRSKRVDIRWHDRQFILPDHIANQVRIGATRNLFIQKCSPNFTEEVIRDDLEHIHNLVLIKIVFNGSSAFISTNSVHNAMFARTCMMSRGAYRNSKIKWARDECAAPLPRRPSPQFDNPPIPKKQNTPLANRFEPLNIYREDESETDTEGKENKIVGADGVDGNARIRQRGGAGVREQDEEVMA